MPRILKFDTIIGYGKLYCVLKNQPHMAYQPGAIARSVAMSLGNPEAPRSIFASGTSFREDLVFELFLRPFFLFR